MVNNLYNGSQVYRGNIAAGIAGYTSPTQSQFIKYNYQPVLNDEYEFNARQANDVLSPARYLPLFTRMNFRFIYKFPEAPAINLLRLRITIFKLKPYPQNNSKLDYSLPWRLGAYHKMAASPGDLSRNYFNPDYMQVMYDKWLIVRNKNQDVGAETFHSIAWKHTPGLEMQPSFNDHPLAQNPATNFPIDQQVWCLISTDEEMGVVLNTVHITRLDSWRDHHAN